MDELKIGYAKGVVVVGGDVREGTVCARVGSTSEGKATSEPGALRAWRERLDYMMIELAKASDPAVKFQLEREVALTEERIRQMESRLDKAG